MCTKLHMNEIIATLILTHTPFLGPATTSALLAHFGQASCVVQALSNNHPTPVPLKQASLEYLRTYTEQKSWQQDLMEAERAGIQLIPYTSTQYPQRLRAIHDAPPLLYVQGSLPDFTIPWITIVGTRTATLQGKDLTQHFAKALASKCIVVSGLARGVDTAAHTGALLTGTTVAVIGSGISCLYPRENTGLAAKIVERGAVISECAMKEPPSRFSFPQRNRILSALSDALLLTEAPEKSGAMLTMQLGLSHKKPLFALPGKAGSPYTQGNHLLIKQGLAKLIDHPEEILHALGHTKQPTAPQKKSVPDLFSTQEEKKIYALLSESEMSLEELSEQIPLPVSALQVTLTKLMLKKTVLEHPGKRYTIVC